MEKKCKKAKWLSGEALQIAVKRREVKSKGKKENRVVVARIYEKGILETYCLLITEFQFRVM